MTQTTQASDYSVKNIKTFIGNEGHGFNATLYCKGKKVAFLIDHAQGGEIDIDWDDFKEPKITVGLKSSKGDVFPMNCTPNEAAFRMMLQGLPKTEPSELFPEGMTVNADIFCGELVWNTLEIRRMNRALKRALHFICPNEQAVSYYSGLQYSVIAAKKIRDKHGEGTIILNELDEPQAFRHWSGGNS